MVLFVCTLCSFVVNIFYHKDTQRMLKVTQRLIQQKMNRIYGIGETVFDIIFKDGSPQAGKAGGSMLNSVVSLGRVGLPVSFISEFASDNIGDLINSFLVENAVDTSFVNRYTDGSTTLAIAFLDENNDASYTFYKNHHPGENEKAYPAIGEGDILLCGSFYSIWSEIRHKFLQLVTGAGKNGALVVYDPNFRESHLNDLNVLKPLIIENMKMAGLIRGSDADFKNVFGAGNADEAYSITKNYCPVLVYSASTIGVFVRTPGFSGKFPVRKIKPLSTIGAGDNFNAGMITAIYKNNISPGQLKDLKEEEWSEIISLAVDFATDVCLSYDNYISRAFASRYFSASSDQI
jgi:fructokinase